MTHSAPHWSLRASLKYCGISSRSCRLNGATAQPVKKLVLGSRSVFPFGRVTSRPWFIACSIATRLTESKSNTGSAGPLNPATG